MNWLTLAFIAPFLWAITNYFDKLIIERYFKSSNIFVITVFPGSVGGVTSIVLLAVFREQLFVSLQDALLLILIGLMILSSLIPYYYALALEETSKVVPFYQLSNVFGIALGIGLLGETYTTQQYIGAAMVITAAFLISFNLHNSNKRKFSINGRAFLLMLLCSLVSAVYTYIYKLMSATHTFWQNSFWQYLGFVIFVIILLVIPQSRKSIRQAFKMNGRKVISIATFSEILNISARYIFEYTLFLAPLSLVTITTTFQPFFVFIIGIILTIFFPKLIKEDIQPRILIQKTILIALIILGSYLIFK